MNSPKQPGSLYNDFIKTLVEKRVDNVADLINKIIDNNTSMNITEKLKQVDRLKGWLDSFRPLSPDVVEELKKNYDVKFTYNSNAIEGNTLTQSETELVLEKGMTIGGKSLTEHLEAVGHKEAIDFIEELADKKTTMTEREIRDIHHLILRSIDRETAGSYRNLDVRAAGTGKIYPPHFRINELMTDFIERLNSDETSNLHPIELATEIHYRFVSIHPFKDGNGRTARLLMNLCLLRHGYPVAVLKNELRSEYIQSLVFAQDNQDDTCKLMELITDSCKESLVEYLQVISTAASSEDKGRAFYMEVQDYIK